ncbi:uncharacterized protein LOC130909896 [Corythoichthys intestinalis]|uniref:uncharacterized protein LOC130909896 n=1 Tax=Corythoichthys intestinalis TaxID=161448 RepID=UPI0025A54130|nr:uncharacterized protein LOC130909896 [Corythoichthys intestinalis]XP_057682820.1 uncharacterized protein LOC130909896 [Corythoichthys intestinalis]
MGDECDSAVNGERNEWNEIERMYGDLEAQILSGIDKNKVKKEQEKHRSVFVKLRQDELFKGSTKPWTMEKLAVSLQQKERDLMDEKTQLKEERQTATWRQRGKLDKLILEKEKERRSVHNFATVATALNALRPKVNNDDYTEAKERCGAVMGIYPNLPVTTTQPNAPHMIMPITQPPPYAAPGIMASIVPLGGQLVMDVEGEGDRVPQYAVNFIEQAVNVERRNRGGVTPGVAGNSPSPRASSGVTVTPKRLGGEHLGKDKVKDKALKQVDGTCVNQCREDEKDMLNLAMTKVRREQQESVQKDLVSEKECDEECKEQRGQDRRLLAIVNNNELQRSRERQSAELHGGYDLRSGKTAPLGQRYELLALRDVTAMMDKMPPLHQGGKMWLSKFLALMSGQTCTLGDIRQMLAGGCSLVQLQAIEEAAGTTDLGRETPLPRVAGQLFEQIKLYFPQPTYLAPTMFPYDVKMSPPQHYAACVENWIEITGKHPASSPESEVLFRTAIVDGLPAEVKKQLKSDPDILVCAEGRFKRHLLHHCRMHAETQSKVDSETEALSKQLLKLQLAKMYGEAKQNKTQQKRETQMLQGPAVMGRGRAPFRGRCGGRGRGAPPPGGRPQYSPSSCFICGAYDHWARECPQYRQQARPMGGAQRPVQHMAPPQAQGTAPSGGHPWQAQRTAPSGSLESNGLAEPIFQVTVAGQTIHMMVDTGATYSSINTNLPPAALSKKTTTLVGFSGQPQTLPFTKPLDTTIKKTGQRFWHAYIHSLGTPINLMGRDLLATLQAQILCGPQGQQIRFPDGKILHCQQSLGQDGQWLMAPLPATSETATIYWTLLNPETPFGGGVYSTYLLWKPWICSLAPYHPPVDPLHCTLFYDRKDDDVYRDLFEEIDGKEWQLSSSCILIGKEGVAAATDLTPEQLPWFKMAQDGYPHISLAVAPGHEARQLGPMVRRLLEETQWVKTNIPDLWWAETENAYKIQQVMKDEGRVEMVLLSRLHGRELLDHEQASAMLETMPDTLWSQGPFDVGYCHSVTPIKLSIDETQIVRRPQYRWPQEADQGMEDTLRGLWDAGVLELSSSTWNTPLHPVRKADGVTWRMVHDLRPVNDVTVTPVLPVPDSHRILASLDPTYQFFTVINLANAYFCLPLSPDVRHVFAFSYGGVKLQYKRLPEGFKNSPGIFNQVLKELLTPCVMPEGTVLLQYAADLLIGAKTDHACLAATGTVLRWLGQLGFKVSKKKLQCCRQKVTFLGRIVSPSGLAMSPEHRNSILRHPRPNTVKEMLSFLGLCGYSRNYIPNFVDKTGILRGLVKEQGTRNLKSQLDWTAEASNAFVSLVQELAYAAALATPNYTVPFHLDVSISRATANGILYQKVKNGRAVLMYCSVSLDNIEQRQPDCSRYAAGLAKILQKIAHAVMGHPLYVLTDHAVLAFVESAAFTLTPLRQTRLLKILTAPNVNYVHTGVNMTDQVLVGPHECALMIKPLVKIRPDLYAEPLDHGRILFTDGCCWRDKQGNLHAAAAVVEWQDCHFTTIKTQQMSTHPSAQAAEILALILALESVQCEAATIYSDSAYATSAAHIDLLGWMKNGFVTAKGTEIAHKDLMVRLSEAIKAPAEVAIVKVPGHSKSDTLVAQGNNAVDAAAKAAAGYHVEQGMMMSRGPIEIDGNPPDAVLLEPLDLPALIDLQNSAIPEQKSVWLTAGAFKLPDNLWVGPNGRPVLPDGKLLQDTLLEAHTPSHIAPHSMLAKLMMW